jgi:hypothetical protein
VRSGAPIHEVGKKLSISEADPDKAIAALRQQVSEYSRIEQHKENRKRSTALGQATPPAKQ